MLSIPLHPVSIGSILVLSTHLRLGLGNDLFPSGFPTNVLHRLICPHLRYMPSPFHPPWLDHSNYTWCTVELMKLLIM
jgi:hypothetical protein